MGLLSRSPDGFDFQHGTASCATRPEAGAGAQLQRERYEPDMNLIPNDARQLRIFGTAGCPEGISGSAGVCLLA